MKRLLVPTDFSEASRIAVGHAVELSDAVGAELLLLHVVDVAMLGSPQLAGIREAFTLTIDPTGNAFSYEVPHAADDRSLWAEAEGKLAALLPPLESGHLRTRVDSSWCCRRAWTGAPSGLNQLRHKRSSHWERLKVSAAVRALLGAQPGPLPLRGQDDRVAIRIRSST
jgi:hypothetical protein